MTKPIYMIVAVPGSGKTWVTNQLKDKFHLVHHDGFLGHINQPEAYVAGILEACEEADKPILCEAPFSIKSIEEPLVNEGHTVEKVFIIEEPEVIRLRYFRREKRMIPKGHLTRMNTYAQRAKASGSFAGTSDEVLNYLKSQ